MCTGTVSQLPNSCVSGAILFLDVNRTASLAALQALLGASEPHISTGAPSEGYGYVDQGVLRGLVHISACLVPYFSAEAVSRYGYGRLDGLEVGSRARPLAGGPD
jgi:hypothetical protein